MLAAQQPIPAATMELMDLDDVSILGDLNDAVTSVRKTAEEWGIVHAKALSAWAAGEDLGYSDTVGGLEVVQLVEHEIKDVEMTPVAPMLPSDAAKLTYIVIDTNVLLSHLHFVSNLCVYLNAEPAFTILLPWIVLEELDRIKDRARYTNGTTTASLPARAGAALKFIHDVLRAHGGAKFTPAGKPEPYQLMRGQRMSETENPNQENNDSRILDCCLWFAHNKPGNVVILSNDNNVNNKAIVHGLPSFKQPGRLGVLELVDKIRAKQEAAAALNGTLGKEVEVPKTEDPVEENPLASPLGPLRRNRAFMGRTGSIHYGNMRPTSVVSMYSPSPEADGMEVDDDGDDVMAPAIFPERPQSIHVSTGLGISGNGIAPFQYPMETKSPLEIRAMSMAQAPANFGMPNPQVQQRNRHAEQNLRIRAWVLSLVYRISLDALYTFMLTQVEKELGPEWIFVVKLPPPWQLSDLLSLAEIMRHTVTFRFYKTQAVPKLQSARSLAITMEGKMKGWMKKLPKPRPANVPDIIWAPRTNVSIDAILSSVPKNAPLKLNEKFAMSPEQREHNYMILSQLTGTFDRSWANANINLDNRDLPSRKDQIKFVNVMEELICGVPIPASLKFNNFKRLIGPLMGEHDYGAKFIRPFYAKASELLGAPPTESHRDSKYSPSNSVTLEA